MSEIIPSEKSVQSAASAIDKVKWSGFIRRFIDVLKINIFAVDTAGGILIPPLREGNRERFGSQFLTSSFQLDFSGQDPTFLDQFVAQGVYWECKDPFDFRIFAIPVCVNGAPVAYVLVGPVVLNKRWENADYINMAGQLNIATEPLLDSIREIRVVSNVTIKAILDLLSEVIKDIVELNFEKQQLNDPALNREVLPQRIADVAQDLYATIHLDEFLITVLDVALQLTQADGGSIMLIDENRENLSIKVSRGLDQQKIENIRVKLGQGVAGVAALENTAFFIDGERADNRIKKFLSRPDLKQSLVVRFSVQDRVLGVLNLHTRQAHAELQTHQDNLLNLCKLISTAISSI